MPPLVLDGTNGVSGVDGTASNPAIEGTDSNTGIFYPAADTVAIGTGGTEALRVNSSQNVGIGTSSPTARLTVVTGAAGNNEGEIRLSENATYYAGLRRVNATDEFRIGSYGASQNITFYTVSSERMRLDASGNLLVGTTSGSVRLDVVQSNPTRGILQRVYNSSPTSQTGAQLQFTQDSTADWVIGQPAGTNAFAFWTGRNPSNDGTERARITSGGDFLVGTTTNGGVGWTFEAVGYSITKKSGTATTVHISFQNNNGEVGKISTSGTATTYGTSSDYRLKENVQPMSNALAKVAELKPVTYKWKVDGSDGQGFIAHELQSVCPDAVIGEKDAVETYIDDSGTEQTRPVYQAVDTSFLIATLTAAIQEQQAMIDELKAKVAALENA